MRLLILVFMGCLVAKLEAFTVQVTNDTGQLHFLLFEKVGYLLNRGDYCTLQISEENWWRKLVRHKSIMLYRQGKDGVFSERFTVRPKGDGDDRIEISISDVHRQAKHKVPYSVQVDKAAGGNSDQPIKADENILE